MFGQANRQRDIARTWARRVWVTCTLLLLVTLAVPTVWAAQPSATPGAGASAARTIPAARRAKNVAVITIRGEIDRVTSASVRRRIAAAQAAGADAIVLEIDTFGGQAGATLEICAAIESAKVPTVAWANTKAISAGAVMALACKEIVAAPATLFGDAAPVVPVATARQGGLRDTERAKALTPLLTQLVDSARRNGYDEQFVQGFATLGVQLWLIERPDTGERRFVTREEWDMVFDTTPPVGRPALAGGGVTNVPTGAAPAASGSPTDLRPAGPLSPDTIAAVSQGLSQPSRLRQLTTAERGKWNLVEYVSDGRGLFTLKIADLQRYGLCAGEVETDEDLRQFFGAQNITRFDQQWYESVAGWLDGPVIKGVLIVLGLLGLFVEMTHPGLILPGAVALLSLGLLLAPDILLGAGGWWELIAVVLGIGLIMLEIFVLPGFGVFGVLGLLLLFGGLLGTFLPSGGFPDSVEQSNNLFYGVVTLVISTAVALVCMYFAGKHFGRLPIVNRLVLKPSEAQGDALLPMAGAEPEEFPVSVGDRGVTLTPLRPAGRVRVGDEVIDVVAGIGYIPAGQEVRVASVSRFSISVEPISPDERMDMGDGGPRGAGPAGGAPGGRA